MSDAARTADLFYKAAELNGNDPLRKGSLLEFPNFGQLVMTGDLHGHRRNLERLRHFCDLEHYGARHVILHEIIHEEVTAITSHDNSYIVLLECAQWKCDFPDQVHFLMGNHDLAQISGHEITKNGRVVTLEFADAVFQAFDAEGEKVMESILEFLRSLPLAGRTPNRVFLSHSLPGPRDMPRFDPSILTRRLTMEDMIDGGSAHALVWGRYQTAEVVNTFRELLDVDFFLCGHQPQETGFDVLHDRLLILASDHNHGVFLTLDLGKPVSLESLQRGIRPLAAIE